MTYVNVVDDWGEHLCRARLANSFMSRFRGLMFTDEKKAEPLLISSTSSVHTFWMRFCLDLFFLDKSGDVLKIAEKVAPGKIVSCKGAFYVLEISSSYKLSEKHLSLPLHLNLIENQ